MFQQLNEDLKKDLSILSRLKNFDYDAMIFEFMVPTAYPIAEYLEIKALLPSISLTHHPVMSRLIGEPASPSVLPSMISSFGDDMSFLERFKNTIGNVFFPLLVNPPTMISFRNPGKVIDIDLAQPGPMRPWMCQCNINICDSHSC